MNDYLAGCLINRKLLDITKLRGGFQTGVPANGPITRYAKLRVAHAPGIPGTFSPPLRVSDPDMYHSTCVTHVPWFMPGSLTSGFLWSRWRWKPEAFYMRYEGFIRHHGNRRWRQIQIWIKVCNAGRPSYNAVRPLMYKHLHIYTFRRTNLFRHCYVHIFIVFV